MDISRSTWKYLHGPDDIAHLSFTTGGVPRSLSVICYAATGLDEIDPGDNGIAIVDNDNMAVVLDGHLSGDIAGQVNFLGAVRKMDWQAFTSFALAHPRYRGNREDFLRDRPYPGSIVNQVQRGVTVAPADVDDLRSPAMVSANSDPRCPYSYPRATRHDMVSEILSHDYVRGADAAWRLSWAARPPAAARSSDSIQEEDRRWHAHRQAVPELGWQALSEVMAPFHESRFATWPGVDAGRYGFQATIDGDTEHLCLDSIDGESLAFRGRGEVGKELESWPDLLLRDLWKLVRTVDQDLSPAAMETKLEAKMAEYRAEYLEAPRREVTVEATPDA